MFVANVMTSRWVMTSANFGLQHQVFCPADSIGSMPLWIDCDMQDINQYFTYHVVVYFIWSSSFVIIWNCRVFFVLNVKIYFLFIECYTSHVKCHVTVILWKLSLSVFSYWELGLRYAYIIYFISHCSIFLLRTRMTLICSNHWLEVRNHSC